MTRGEGGLAKRCFCITRGGGVQTPPKKDDIIYEQPLGALCMFNRPGQSQWLLYKHRCSLVNLLSSKLPPASLNGK